MKYIHIDPRDSNLGWITLSATSMPLDINKGTQPGWTRVANLQDWITSKDLVWSCADEEYVHPSLFFDMPKITFVEKAQEHVEQSVLDLIKKGDWLQIDYANRIKPTTFIRQVWERIDKDRLLEKVVDRIEDRIAHQIVASITNEIGKDVKTVMSDGDFRAELKAMIKIKLRERGISS